MRTVKTLYKAFGASLEMPRPESNGKARVYGVFGFIAFALIFIPSSILVGYITYLLSNLLMFFGERSYALISLVHIISAFTMIFILPVMFNVLFFAKDLAYLRALPIKPVQLFKAKFWHTCKAENVMTSVVLLSMYIGWYVAYYNNFGSEVFNPVTIISTILSMFLIPVLPLIYCSVICTLLMAVLRKVRKISVFYYSSTLLFVVFAFVFLLSFRGQGGVNIEHYVDMLVKGENSFNDLCDVLFFSTPLLARAMGEHDILKLLIAAVVTAALYVLMILVAKGLYNEGLYTSACLGAGKKARVSTGFRSTSNGTLAALVKKEFRVLMRTMSYRTNCVYANLIWPVLAVVFFVLSKRNVNLLRFITRYKGGGGNSRVIILIIVIALAFIASGLNSISSTSFTREGAHIDIIKYLPVDGVKLILSKAIVSIVFTYVPLIFAIVFSSYSLYATVSNTLFYLFVALLGVIAATAVGIIMDSIAPYTVWSDEATALRGNMNCFFNLAAGLLASVIICGLIYLLYIWQGSNIYCNIFALISLLVFAVLSVSFGLKKVKRNLGI